MLQALQCLVSILRSLVDWYMRTSPGGATEGVPTAPELQAAAQRVSDGNGPADPPKPDWETLTSKPSQSTLAELPNVSASDSTGEI